MPIRCPQCGRKHDVARFSADSHLHCQCGFKLDLSLMETVDDFLRFFESDEERKKALEIQKDAQAICRMILDEDSPEVDIEIAKERLRKKVKGHFPDKMPTYKMIYQTSGDLQWRKTQRPSRL